MNCPRCTNGTLEERERAGVVLEVCTQCRGLWLDRGELEKLVARATVDFDGDGSRKESTPPRGIRTAGEASLEHSRSPPRKRRWFDALGNIFD